jgi:hypothetical protein
VSLKGAGEPRPSLFGAAQRGDERLHQRVGSDGDAGVALEASSALLLRDAFVLPRMRGKRVGRRQVPVRLMTFQEADRYVLAAQIRGDTGSGKVQTRW